MYEVEIKVRADHDAVRSALEAAGADRVGEVRQVDTYYDAPHRDFAETDEALRLRRATDEDGAERATLTYKGPRVESGAKTRREVETGVSDPGDADALLAGVGFAPAATVEKRRERFELGEYEVALDAVSGLGEFVEVETEAPESDLGAARDGAVAILADLGLDPSASIETSYLGLSLRDNQQE